MKPRTKLLISTPLVLALLLLLAKPFVAKRLPEPDTSTNPAPTLVADHNLASLVHIDCESAPFSKPVVWWIDAVC